MNKKSSCYGIYTNIRVGQFLATTLLWLTVSLTANAERITNIRGEGGGGSFLMTVLAFIGIALYGLLWKDGLLEKWKKERRETKNRILFERLMCERDETLLEETAKAHGMTIDEYQVWQQRRKAILNWLYSTAKSGMLVSVIVGLTLLNAFFGK